MKSLIFKQTEILACQIYMDGKPFACLRCDYIKFDDETGNVDIIVNGISTATFYYISGVCLNKVID